MKTVFVVLAISLLVPLTAVADSRLTAPPGWVAIEFPTRLPAPVRSVTGFKSPDGTSSIILTEFREPITKAKDADDLIRGQVGSMMPGGFEHDQTIATTFHGFDARKLTGTTRGAESGSLLAIESYAVFTEKAVYSVTVASDATRPPEGAVPDPLEFVEITDPPIALSPEAGSSGSSAGGTAGSAPHKGIVRIAGWVFLAVLLAAGIRLVVVRMRGN